MSPHTHRSPEARYELMTQGLAEVHGEDLIRNILKEGKSPKGVWGTAPTGRPHIGYLVPFVKIAECMEAGTEWVIYIGDLFAFLVNYKHPLPLVGHRAQYYIFALSAVFEAILGVPASNLRFRLETSWALGKEFTIDNYKLSALTSQRDVKATDDEIGNTAMLSPLHCPGLQTLAEEYLNVDFQFGGLDQAGIFAFAEDFLPKLGYKKRAHFMNLMLPGLMGTKMSASDPRSKIDLLDSSETVFKKIMNATCEVEVIEENPILALLKIVIIPISKLRLERGGEKEDIVCESRPFVEEDAPDGAVFSVQIEKGKYKHYKSYEDIELDFCGDQLRPDALKEAVAGAIDQLLEHVRKSYEGNQEWQNLMKLAYPDVVEETGTQMATDASLNFCFPAALREISNDLVKLIPFNSSVHASEFIRLSSGHPELYAYIPLGPFSSTQSFVSDFIEGFVRPNSNMLLYAVIDKSRDPTAVDKEGALAGVLSFQNTCTVKLSTDIGFVITLPQFQRTHVTTNAVGLLLDFALSPTEAGGLGLRRVQWQTSKANQASIRAAEKMGFVQEGVLRWDCAFSGAKTNERQSRRMSSWIVGAGVNSHDLGRDTVLFSMCWDDWLEGGKREHMTRRMARKRVTPSKCILH